MIETTGRVTVKDVAAQAGVAISTVHLVLTGKPGVGDETRKRVLEIVEALDYRPNTVASSLKRGVTRIAVLRPILTEGNLYYYGPIWDGVRAFFETVRDFKLKLVEILYESEDLVEVSTQAIERLSDEEKVAGLIALGKIAPDAMADLRLVSDQGIPIVLINSDTPEVGRVCCVQADNYLLGRMMGEIIFRQTPRGSGVLICAGDEYTPANAESVRGLEDYLRDHDGKRALYKLHNDNDVRQLYHQTVRQLQTCDDIGSCCSVTARGSVQLARALVHTGKAGLLPAIGTDVFQQNIESLKKGIFTNLVFKNPFQQGWIAAEKIFDYVIRNHHPEREVFYVKSEMILQSAISMYAE